MAVAIPIISGMILILAEGRVNLRTVDLVLLCMGSL